MKEKRSSKLLGTRKKPNQKRVKIEKTSGGKKKCFFAAKTLGRTGS